MASVIITGTNRGTGAGIAEVLREAGYHVVGWDRTVAAGSDTVKCDVRDPDQVGRAAAQLPPDLGAVVANAGIRRFGAVDDLPLTDWRDSVDTNLSGVYYLARATLPLLRANRGVFIVIGSHAEKYPFEGGAAYCATKLALRGLVDCLIADARHDGVRATYLSLGAIKNRDHGQDEQWKLTPRHVGQVVLAVLRLPEPILVPYLDARPLCPPQDGAGGIGRLQTV